MTASLLCFFLGASAPSVHPDLPAQAAHFMSGKPTIPQRSVLVVVLDDVAQADVEEVVADGFAPNLARIAAEGMTFEPTPGLRGGFSNPVCSPARRSILFSQFHFDESGIGCEPFPGAPSVALTSLG